MGYGALSAADYFDVNPGDANPKVYSFKQGRNGWNATAATYANTKPLGSSAVTPGAYSITSSFLPTTESCTGITPDSELVRCVGFAAIAGASSGLGAWLVGSDASYRPVDIRETVLSGQYIYDNSGATYSFNIPYKDLFKADTDGDLINDYNNLKKLDPAFSGTSKYVFYNRTQHTGIMAGMGGRMLGYDTVGMRNGLPEWNNTVGEKFMGSTVGTLMTGQATGSIYAGTISTLYPANSGLNLAPTITAGPSVGSITDTSVTITWDTDYPATSMVKYSTIPGGPYTMVNDTILNTSHSVALTGLSSGTTYYIYVVSYDCVANKVESSEGGFTTLPPSCVPSAEVCDGVDNDCDGLVDEGVLCDDTDTCTSDSCSSGVCTYTAISCDDGDACTADSCDPATGCAYAPVSCDDGNVCTDDTCNPATGCVNTNNTASCDDGNACTSGDVCSGGSCAGTAISCDDSNVCTDDSCNPATGCVNTNNTASCDDGDACTTGDACSGGACVGTPVVCTALDQCHNAGTCDPATGVCSNPNKPDGTSCDDGNACTTGDACSNGVCVGGAAPAEVCDGIDNDCNGLVDEGVLNTYYEDFDGDGFGNPEVSKQACAPPPGFVTNNTDCNDTNKDINPAAVEVCDGVDNDCDGLVDEGVLNTYYKDFDGDGHGNPEVSKQGCIQPDGYVIDNTDCDDSDNTIFPGAPEICDDKDNDCDGIVDEGFLNTYYEDADLDGFGNPNVSIQACRPPLFGSYVTNNTDCDDTNDEINPEAVEVCDGVDNDCDGLVDEGFLNTYYEDVDGDGFGNPNVSIQACTPPPGFVTDNTDCNDNDPTVNPGMTEVPYNGKDDDCNPATKDDDLDGDGFLRANDCNARDNKDNDATVNPGAKEGNGAPVANTCGDGKDNDCDGLTDGADPDCFDYDITLNCPPNARVGAKDIVPTVDITNHSKSRVDPGVNVRVKGTLNGKQIYNEVQKLHDLANGTQSSSFKFSPYKPTEAGKITWTATLTDGDDTSNDKGGDVAECMTTVTVR